MKPLPKNRGGKIIYCLYKKCHLPASKIIRQMKVGVCEKHANHLLTSAILVKLTDKKV